MTNRRSRRLAAVWVGFVLVVGPLAGCGGLLGSTGSEPAPSPSATRAATPPPGASQAPGPPLATASAIPGGPVDRTNPVAVAADCFERWQSFDARTDPGPGAGVERARDCLTEDFAASLGAGAGGAVADTGADGQAWQEVRAAGTRSTVSVLAAGPLGGIDTTASGRVVLLLNVRRETVAAGAAPVVTVSTPTLTLLRGTDGTWRVAGADLANAAGDAPGR